MDRVVWQATDRGFAKSRTQLSVWAHVILLHLSPGFPHSLSPDTRGSHSCNLQMVSRCEGFGGSPTESFCLPPPTGHFLSSDRSHQLPLATWCKKSTHWKRHWCWETLKAGGDGDGRWWDGWRASLTQWTRAWANYRRWWRTGKPGMGLQRFGHNWVTK